MFTEFKLSRCFYLYFVQGGIVVLEIYPNGAAKKDGRLQPGDQLIEVNGTSFLDITNTNASGALRQLLPKVQIIFFL